MHFFDGNPAPKVPDPRSGPKVPTPRYQSMTELLRTNDPVLISWLRALLGDDGIELIVLDSHMSVMEGSISAIPRRVMVHDDHIIRARRLLDAAEIDYDRTNLT